MLYVNYCRAYFLILVTFQVNNFETVYAEVEGAKEYESLFGLAGLEFDSENSYDDPNYMCKGLILSVDEIIFDYNGMVSFVDVIAEVEDGSYINISSFATWESEDESIASAFKGRIYAEGVGETLIKVAYGGYEQKIIISVQSYVDYESIAQMVLKGLKMQRVVAAVDTGAILTRASEMKSYVWTPTQNLTGHNGKFTYQSGVSVTGLPYSHGTQCNKTEFVTKLSSSDFYINTVSPIDYVTITPRYGVDCSGFVSKAFNSARYTSSGFITAVSNGVFSKVGNYNVNDPTTSELITSYASMMPGDALTKSGHSMLVYNINYSTQTVMVYEQAYRVPQYSTFSYSELASSKYIPFRMK